MGLVGMSPFKECHMTDKITQIGNELAQLIGITKTFKIENA